jgi:ATP-binding cassette subfamily B protein
MARRQAVRLKKKSGDNLAPARLTSPLMPSVTPLLVTRASARVRPVGALWRLRGYLRPFRRQMIIMLAAALGAVAAEIAIPLLTKSVIDGAIAHGARRLLIPLALAAVGLGAAVALMNMIRRWIQAGAVAEIEKSMRDDLYAHLQRLPVSFHDNWQSGQLLSRATTDLSSIRRFAGFGLIFLVTNVMTFVAVVALLINLNWWLGLITGVVFAPVLPVCIRFEKRYRVLSRRVQDQQGDLATLIEEAATGIRVLKALGRGRQAAARHDAQAAEVYRTQVTKAGLLGSFWALLDLIPNAVIGIIIVLGAIAVSKHSLTLGGLVAFITLALQLVWPVEALGYIIASGQEAATAAQRVLEIFDTRPDIADKEQGQFRGVPGYRGLGSAQGAHRGLGSPQGAHRGLGSPQGAHRGLGSPQGAPCPLGPAQPERAVVRAAEQGEASHRGVPPRATHPWVPGPRKSGSCPNGQRSRGHLVFDHVAFSYPGAAEPVLRDIVLDLPPGQTMVLTGATGSGKSTLLQLVPRLADASSGVVWLDGTDVRDLPLEQLRAAVGCAFEDATLFSASVRENVTFGAPNADADAVEAALTAAQARFAYDLPWGLDTRIGEQGMALSGGQRQRIALARAILAGPDVLILDDPLSALDVHTEERVTRALHEILAGSTALVVAHRPSTVALADTVALLSGGVIAASGSHRALLTSNPEYAALMDVGDLEASA